MQPELISEAEGGIVGFARSIAERFNLPKTFIKFLIVGGIGFVIYQSFFALMYETSVLWFLPGKDVGANLLLFTHPDILLLIASVVAVEVAIFFQFNSHERWTFRNRNREGNLLFRFAKFNLSSIVSPIIIVVTVNVLTPVFGWSPYISNIIGVGLGVSWNWVVNTLIIWPHQRLHEAEKGSTAAG